MDQPARETLSEYVSRIMKQKRLTHVLVAQRARELGAELSPAFMNSIKQSITKSPKINTLKALALGLGESEDDLFAVARGVQLSEHQSYRSSDFAIMHEEYSRLSKADQKFLASTLEILKQAIQQRLPTSDD